MKTLKLTGVLLRIKPAGEYDRTIFIFSREYGLSRIIAKGTRKIASRRGFHLDILNAVRMEIEETASGHYLREITTLNAYATLKRNPRHFASACVIASFLLSFLPEGMPQRNLFLMTKKMFDRLNKVAQNEGRKDLGNLLLIYLLKSTRELGYLPHSIPKSHLRRTLAKVLSDLNPQFTLQARRMLGIFESFKSTRSS